MFEQSSRAFAVGSCLGHEGSGYLKKNMRKFNKAARGVPFFVLTDLDQTDCPPMLRNGDEITSPTMHHSFRPPLSDFKSQKP